MEREPIDGEHEQFLYEQTTQPEEVLAFFGLIGIVGGILAFIIEKLFI